MCTLDTYKSMYTYVRTDLLSVTLHIKNDVTPVFYKLSVTLSSWSVKLAESPFFSKHSTFSFFFWSYRLRSGPLLTILSSILYIY